MTTDIEKLQTDINFKKALMDNTAVAIFLASHNRIIEYANKRACELFGYNQEELVGSSFEIIHQSKELFEKFAPEYRRLTSSGISNVEYPFKSKSGDIFYCSVYGTALDQSDLSKGIIWTLIDITEEKNAKKELKLSEYATKKSSDTMYWMNPEGYITKANDSACNMLGYTLEEISSLHISQIVPELSQKEWETTYDTLKKTGNTKLDILHKTKAGELIPVGITADYIFLDNKEFVFAIARDLSEQKQLNLEMENAKRSAEKADLAKSQFLANMSHEIRTPMNAILGLTNLVLDTNLSHDQRDYLQKINLAGKSLLHILNDILDYSKIEAGKLDIYENEFTLDGLFQHLSNLFLPMTEYKNIDLTFSRQDNVPEKIISDELRIGQILSNLIGNAIKFTEKGFVKISAELVSATNEHEIIKFAVTDTGIGLDREQVSRLFRPFSQADGSITRKYGGTGLGLAISNELVELMGGNFSVSSELGTGSTFAFTIKTKISKFEKNERAHHINTKELLDSAKILSSSTILLVEDNKLNQDVAKGLLNKLGIDVTVADNGKEAIELLSKNRYDCILMDMQMPIMNGIEATEYIRNTLKMNEQKIIAMTAAAMDGDKETCINAGMNDYISKPIEIENLITVLLKQIKNVDSTIASVTISQKHSNGEKLSAIDIEAVMGRFLLTQNEVIKLLKNFADSNRDFIEVLDKLLLDMDFKTAATVVHKIKGSSANLGVTDVYACAVALERDIKCGEITHTLANFKNSLHFAIAQIDQQSECITNETECVDITVSIEQAMEALGDLEKKLQSRSFIDFKEKESIFEILDHSELDKDLVNELKNHVNKFDYIKALEAVENISNTQKDS